MAKDGSRRLETIYGVHSVLAILDQRPGEVRELLVTGGGARSDIREKALALGITVTDTDGARLAKLAGSEAHQGVAARAPLPGFADLDELAEREPRVLAALDGVTDPRNLGAIARTAEALGASGLVVPKDRSAGITAAAHKASAGALEYLPAAEVVNLSRALRGLKEMGYWVYGADAGGEVLSDVDFSGPAVVVIGSEGSGIRPGVSKNIDRMVRVSQRGRTKSLNAGVACAIILDHILNIKNSGQDSGGR